MGVADSGSAMAPSSTPALVVAAEQMETAGWTRASLAGGPIALVSGDSARDAAVRYAHALGTKDGSASLARLLSDVDDALSAASRLMDLAEQAFVQAHEQAQGPAAMPQPGAPLSGAPLSGAPVSGAEHERTDSTPTLEARAPLAAAVPIVAERPMTPQQPTMADVEVLESAIQSIRFQRSVFLSALDLVTASDAERQIAGVSIRGRFDAASLRMSALANDIAATAIEQKLSDAGILPAPSRTAAAGGSDMLPRAQAGSPIGRPGRSDDASAPAVSAPAVSAKAGSGVVSGGALRGSGNDRHLP